VGPFDNVFLVTIDTLRADHLGSYGYPRAVSPFMDSLAARGIRFERAISSSSHTAPSHASILTSQYPARHRVLVNGMLLDQGIPTLAGLLADSDFESGAFLSVQFLGGIGNGFDVVDHEVPPGRPDRPADLTVDATLDWFAQRDAERRAFVWVHLYDPHQTAGRHHVPRPALQGMKTDARRREGLLRSHWMRQHGVGADEIDGLVRRVNRYDAQIAFVDSQVRRLVESIDSAGGRNLWIITADHGEGLGDHGYIGHGEHLWQEQLRVPSILYGGEEWPSSGETVESMVELVDLLPTVLELVGVPPDPDADFEGRSLAGLLLDARAARPVDFAFSQRRPPNENRLGKGWEPGLVLAGQSQSHKYILHSDAEDEFFDLVADGLEKNNLIDEESPAKDELLRWLVRKYEAMLQNPLAAGSEGIEKEYLEELEALGYL
jgi:arylsulfatase A-like enzyme